MEIPLRKKLYRHQKKISESTTYEIHPPFPNGIKNIIYNTINFYILVICGRVYFIDDNGNESIIDDPRPLLYELKNNIKQEKYLQVEKFIAQTRLEDDIDSHFSQNDKYCVFDIIQFISFSLKTYAGLEIAKRYEHEINNLFKIELIPYRIISGDILETTDESMIDTLNNILKFDNKYQTTVEHIKLAMLSLADKKDSYEEGIRESINAIESLGMIFAGKKHTLSKTLDELKKRLPPHPAFQEAINKLYAWTGDDGIRHGKWPGGQSATYDEAILLLGLSSSLVNYMIKADIKA